MECKDPHDKEIEKGGRKMDIGMKVHYRKERGWSGKLYYVQISEKEYRERERVKLAFGIILGMPLMVFIMAMAAGMI